MSLTTTEFYDALDAAGLIHADTTVPFNGALQGCKTMLYTNTLTITKATVLADLTVPTYTGYGSVTTGFTGPTRDDSGFMGLDSTLQTFQMDDDDDPTVVLGYGIVDTGGTHLLAAENFPAAQALQDPYSFVAFVIRWQCSNEAAGGATLVV